MPKASGIYGSFLSAEDIHEPTQATIAGVTVAHFERDGKEQTKLVLSFDDLHGRLAVNKTNAEALIERLGDDYDFWKGKTITLEVVQVEYRGKPVPGIRIK